MTTADRGRRRFVARGLAAAAGVSLVACGSSEPDQRRRERSAPIGIRTLRYGSDPSQVGELSLPDGAESRRSRAVPVVVLIHGGFWRAQYGRDLMGDLAADVTRRGWAAWNIEYRRVGQDGGGWSGTFSDVAAAIDHLERLGPEEDVGADLDRSQVAVVGHSAGGQLAVWAAGRTGLAASVPGSAPRVRPKAAVSQAGVLDLAGAARAGVGGTAVADLMGGGPDEVPERYRVGSPLAMVPISVAVRCVHGRSDANVPFSQSERYVAAASTAGGDASLAPFEGDHFDVLDPTDESWTATVAWLAEQFGS